MSEPTQTTSTTAQPKKRKLLRIIAWVCGGGLLLLGLLVAGVSYYTTTADFQRRVSSEVVKVLEDATGGRVELGQISFNLWHLAIEADGLVIHGTEGVGEMPYLSAEKIFIRLRIHTFLSHAAGDSSSQSRVGLNYLRVEQPHIHLIIDKNGRTNQPVPKHPATSTEPVQDTLLDLQAGTVEFADGLAVLNDRAIPFDMAAANLSASVQYLAKSDRYGISLTLNDLRTRMEKQPEVQSKLSLTAELGRDTAVLKTFDFTTGTSTHLTADALLNHFAKPEWQATVRGEFEMKQVGYLAGLEGFSAGKIDLDVHGRNCEVAPQVAQKRHFWQRKNTTPPDAKSLPPDPECKAGYLVVGSMKAREVAFRNENVRLHDVSGGAQLHITPTQLLFTALTGYLPGGGSAEGTLRIENWLGEVAADAAAGSATAVGVARTVNNTAKSLGTKAPVQSMTMTPVASAHAYLTVDVKQIPLRTIMDVTAPVDYGDLGFDTSITGPVKIEWGGPVKDVSDSVLVDAALKFAPVGLKRRGALSDIPITGEVLGHYDGKTETVAIPHVLLQSPQMNLTANGILGVNNGDPLTNLQVNLQARDLSEFDQLLQTLGFEANGKKGTAAIPVVLHGTLGFTGTARGAIADLDVKGHLIADNFALKLGTEADIHIDSVVADAEYSPYGGVLVSSSTIRRNTALLNLAGTFRPHRVVSRRGVVSYDWDKDLALDTSVTLANAQATDLLQIAGQQQKVPITGTVNLNAHVSGTVSQLSGSGRIALTSGQAYGENYQQLAVDVTAQGQQINVTKLVAQAHDMNVSGSGGYNISNKHIQARLTGQNLVLSKFDTVKKANPDADGVLSLDVDADGTLEVPNLHAKVNLVKITVDGKTLGDMNATAYSTGSTVLYDLHSTLVGAQIAANGKTSLTGNYDTQATMHLSGYDIANTLSLLGTTAVKGSSQIAGTVEVSGPLARPQAMVGSAELSDVDLKLEGVELKTAEPLKASLKAGVVTLDQVHITGQDTDLHASGTVQVMGDSNPLGGAMNLSASGSVSMVLARTFDPDLITSGQVTFKMAAEGRLKKPSLSGNVDVKNVNLAVDGIPNGLSNMNGSLIFNEDRLEVQNLTATTGGGQLKIGGSLTYQKGVFADLTATGDTVRVRLYGLSATATSNFRLQGTQQSLLLSGNILITRFGVGPDVDFAAFSGGGGVQAPSDPDSATNKIRLDVHITSAPQLDFQNSYAKLAGTVDLTIRGTLATPSVLGRIQITDGSATFAGTKYQLERGSIYFTNPVRIDPVIDLDATARVENYDLTIGLHGTTTNLKPTYRSEPPLTEADIVNLLALGRTQEEAQLYQEQQVQAGTDPTTSALLGGALNATVGSRVGKLFGAGSVKIDPAFVGTLGNSAARITVEEPISKQVTLVFATNVNQTAEQLIQVQYQINESTSLVATRDESGVFSLVYKIRKRYR